MEESGQGRIILVQRGLDHKQWTKVSPYMEETSIDSETKTDSIDEEREYHWLYEWCRSGDCKETDSVGISVLAQ